VWFAPLVVHLGHRAHALGSRWSLTALCAFWVTFAGWFVSVGGGTPEAGLLSIRLGGRWDVWLPAAYLLAFVAVLVATAWWLRAVRRDVQRDAEWAYVTGTATGGVLYPLTRTQLAVTNGLGTTASSSVVSPGKTVT
jgi:alpha-1,2-mannosyltransferase